MEPRPIGRYVDKMDRRIIPDYDTDLNACADLEAKLTDEQHDWFRELLHAFVSENGESPDCARHKRAYVSASATQRASALILTLVENVEP